MRGSESMNRADSTARSWLQATRPVLSPPRIVLLEVCLAVNYLRSLRIPEQNYIPVSTPRAQIELFSIDRIERKIQVEVQRDCA